MQCINKMQSNLARELQLETRHVAPKDIIPRLLSSPTIYYASYNIMKINHSTTYHLLNTYNLKDINDYDHSSIHVENTCNSAYATNVEIHSNDICILVSQHGIVDGIAPQSVAVAVILITAYLMAFTTSQKVLSSDSSIINSFSTALLKINPNNIKIENCSKNKNTNSIQNTKSSGTTKAKSTAISNVLRIGIVPCKVISHAFAGKESVKNAYNMLRMNASLIIPSIFKKEINSYRTVKSWTEFLPVFDHLYERNKLEDMPTALAVSSSSSIPSIDTHSQSISKRNSNSGIGDSMKVKPNPLLIGDDDANRDRDGDGNDNDNHSSAKSSRLDPVSGPVYSLNRTFGQTTSLTPTPAFGSKTPFPCRRYIRLSGDYSQVVSKYHRGHNSVVGKGRNGKNSEENRLQELKKVETVTIHNMNKNDVNQEEGQNHIVLNRILDISESNKDENNVIHMPDYDFESTSKTIISSNGTSDNQYNENDIVHNDCNHGSITEHINGMKIVEHLNPNLPTKLSYINNCSTTKDMHNDVIKLKLQTLMKSTNLKSVGLDVSNDIKEEHCRKRSYSHTFTEESIAVNIY